MTFDLDIWHVQFTLTLSRSLSTVKLIRQSSRSQVNFVGGKNIVGYACMLRGEIKEQSAGKQKVNWELQIK